MIEKMILEVLDNPKDKRIIVGTKLPSLDEFSPRLYYMIGRSPDCGDTIADMWFVTPSIGNEITFKSHELLLEFIMKLDDACKDLKCYVESY